MELAHTILAMVGGVPARVKCNTCHSDRKFRAPAKAKGKGTVRRTKTDGKPKLSSAEKAKNSRNSSDFEKQSAWEALAAKAHGNERRPYNMRESFEAGQAMDHKKFGVGFVTASAGPGKIRVCFRDGERILVHGR